MYPRQVSSTIEPQRSVFDDGTQKHPDIILYNPLIHRGATVAIDLSVSHPVTERLSAVEGAALRARANDKDTEVPNKL